MALASMEQQHWEEEEEAVEVGLKRRHESRRQEMEETAATTTVSGMNDTTNGIESTDIITQFTNTIPELISKTEVLTELPIPELISKTEILTELPIPELISRTEILTELPIPRPPLKTWLPEPDIQVNPSHIDGTASNGSIATTQESRHHYTDMYLEPTFQKQPTQEFFCPNCNTCIRKVVLRDSDWQIVPSPPPVAPEPIVVLPEPEPPRCTSCFSFLIPVGSWFNGLIGVKKEDDEKEAERDRLLLNLRRGTSTTKIPGDEREKGEDKKPHSGKLDDQNEKGLETSKGPSPFVIIQGGPASEAGEQIEDDRVDKARPKEEPSQIEVIIDGKTSGDKKTRGKLSPIHEIPSKAKEKEETEQSGKGPVESKLPTSTQTVAGPTARTETEVSAEPGEGDKLEILKSIVYGGLAESITSLSVVTSAAGANVSSSKVIAMALANLIGGFFVIIHNIWDLKAEQARTVLNENEEVDRYQKLLGKKKNFALHATFVLLSFLVFGVEPPLVYGFSFRESDNIDYKLAVVAGASFLCISLLALGKAHIQKPSSYHAYLKTLVNYLVIGFAASGISYVAGDLIRKLLNKLGLFKSESEAAFFLPFNDVSVVNPTWSSY